MNHAHMREWIDDLRANGDKQIDGALTKIFIDSEGQQSEKDCCLGRVCKLAKMESNVVYDESAAGTKKKYISRDDFIDDHPNMQEYNSESTLPAEALWWLGVNTGNPIVIDISPMHFGTIDEDAEGNKMYVPGEHMIEATDANDELDFSFSQIADCLEWNYMYVGGVLVA